MCFWTHSKGDFPQPLELVAGRAQQAWRTSPLRWGTPSNPRLTAHLSVLSAGNTRGEFSQLTLPKPESWSHGHRYLPRGAHLCFHLGDSLFRQGAGLHHRKSFCLQICKYFLAIQKRSKGALFIFSSPWTNLAVLQMGDSNVIVISNSVVF